MLEVAYYLIQISHYNVQHQRVLQHAGKMVNVPVAVIATSQEPLKIESCHALSRVKSQYAAGRKAVKYIMGE